MKKILCVSSQTSKKVIEDVALHRVSWQDLGDVKNFADIDGIFINFSTHDGSCNVQDERRFFDLEVWYHVLKSGGRIVCVATAETSHRLANLLQINCDVRPLDFSRVACGNENTEIQSYLDAVSNWSFSFSQISISTGWGAYIGQKGQYMISHPKGLTTFGTHLACHLQLVPQGNPNKGEILVLPISGNGSDFEDEFILREFFQIVTSQPEPQWINTLQLPGECDRKEVVARKKMELEALKEDISNREAEIVFEKRWYRLLYDGGHSLEDIVKEAIELLGGRIERASKEKEDWRLALEEYPTGIIEIKGTHKSTFGAPALRSLAHWLDEEIERSGSEPKGIFIGNSLRNEEPKARGNLFEQNNANLALVRKMVIIRTLDLFCLVVLQLLGQLDQEALWKQIFDCAGPFDASDYHKRLPPQFVIIAATPAVV